MSFYVCPGANRYARALLLGSEIKHAQPRIPLAQRALIAEENCRQFRPQAEAFWGQKKFELGRNDFTLHVLSPSANKYLGTSLVSHLAAVFKNKNIGIWLVDYKIPHKHPVAAVVWVFDERIDLPVNRFTLSDDIVDSHIYRLQLDFNDKEMRLGYIKSKQSGYAGSTLGALYSIAQGLGIERITYHVHEENENARQFYLHTDFGRPLDRAMMNWVVEIKQD
jgi:hypothetical protein